jgi:glycopeptide antibiotics resistance protein
VISRRTWLVAAMVFTLVAACGSLVPFELRTGLTLDRALARFSSLNFFSVGPGSRSDWIANVLLFLPIGYCWLAALSLDETSPKRRLVAAVAVVLSSTLASLALEFTQIWFRDRTVSQNDVIAETLGGLVGALLWMTTGQITADWLRDLGRTRRKSDRFVRILAVYLAGLMIISVLPLDLTISTGDLVIKVRAGGFVLVPFSEVAPGLAGALGILLYFVAFVPVGMLLGLWKTRAATRVRPLPVTAVAGVAAAAVVELAQVLVLSRVTSTTDWLVGAAGAAAGGAFIQWLYTGWYGADAVDRHVSLNKHAVLWTLDATAATGVIGLLFLSPFEVSGTTAAWRERYEAMWTIPFSRGSSPAVLGEALKIVLAFAVFGAILARAVKALSLPDPMKRVVAVLAIGVGAVLAFAIEILQAMLPTRVPDITDVILAALGTAAGVLLAFFFL